MFLLVFWNDHQHKFPILAILARDILSVPATGAGVERLLSSARDVCHYWRGFPRAQAIQDLILFLCTSKFDIEEHERALVEEYLSLEEIEVERSG